jgi:two pore calcium channel protein
MVSEVNARSLQAPLLLSNDPKSNIERAAWELEDAIFDGKLPKEEDETTIYPDDVSKARELHVRCTQADRYYLWAIVGLVVLTFMEVPAWCHGENLAKNEWTFHSGDMWCVLPKPPEGNANPNLSGVMYLPPGYAFIVEVVIEMMIIWKFFLGWKFENTYLKPLEGRGKQEESKAEGGIDMAAWIKRNLNLIGFVLAIGSILDTAAFIFYRFPFRLTFIFRTGLVFLLPQVQHPFWNIFCWRVMAEFMSVAVFFIVTVLFFAWIGFTMFGSNEDFAYKEGDKKVKANEGMEDFLEAINTFFIGGVTGEFIDSFLPSFTALRFSGAIWMIYLLLTQVLFKNLVMDTLISAYLKGYKEEEKAALDARTSAVYNSFVLLSRDGRTVTREDFLALVEILAESPRWSGIPHEASQLMYDEIREIDKENWVDVVAILQNDYYTTQRNSVLALQDSNNAEAKWLREAVWGGKEEKFGSVEDVEEAGETEEEEMESAELPKFDTIMNYVLVVNFGLVIFESYFDYNGKHEPGFLSYIDIAFSLIYVGEVAVKLAVKSFGQYWADGGNRFDFLTTWVLLFTSVLNYLPFDFVKADLSHYANILRLLRLIRILKTFKTYPQVQFMLSTVTRIVNEASEVLALMGTFFFFFCTLAVNLFGGLLYEGNEALEGSEYAEKHWYILNFNDMFMAFMTWFVQILCEYVPNYSDALRRTATHKGLAYGPYAGTIVFFFYITTAAIMYELLLAFTVEVFMAVKDEEEGEAEDEELREVKEEKKELKEDLEEEGEEEEEESEFIPGEFYREKLGKLKTVFADLDPPQDFHYCYKGEAALIKEFKESYEERTKQEEIREEKEGYTEEYEEASDESICKAGWIFESGICHDGPQCNLKHLKVPLDELYPSHIVTAREAHYWVLWVTEYYYKAIMGLVILTLLEVPSWCHGSSNAESPKLTMTSFAPGTDWCQAPTPGGDLNLSGIWYLPPLFSVIAEVVIEAIIFTKFWLERKLEVDHFKPVQVHDESDEPGGVMYYSKWNLRCGLTFSVCSIIDTFLFAILQGKTINLFGHSFQYAFRFTFIFRTGLLCLLPGVQRLYGRIFNRQMIGQLFSVAVFFIVTVLFYAWIAVTLYRHPPGSKDPRLVAYETEKEKIYVDKGFLTLSQAVYTMFLAGMTEGFSEIFIPSVTANRAVALLWLSFLLLTQILFLNLVIDSFVYSYMTGTEKHLDVTANGQAEAVIRVSDLLFSGGKMSLETFQRFIAEVSKSPRMRTLSPEVAKAIFGNFDTSGEISKENFCDVSTLIQNPMWAVPQDSVLKKNVPQAVRDFVRVARGALVPGEVYAIGQLEGLQAALTKQGAYTNIEDFETLQPGDITDLQVTMGKLQNELVTCPVSGLLNKAPVKPDTKIVLAKEDANLDLFEELGEPKSKLDKVMEWVLFFNMIYVLWQSFDDMPQVPKIPHYLFLGFFFTFVYVVEVFLKLAVMSWATYCSTFQNKFDFFTTWLLFGTTMLKHFSSFLPDDLRDDLAKYANVFRLLRLIRVIKNLKNYKNVQFMVKTISQMLEAAGDILMFLMVCLYFFTTASVNFFGGLLYKGNDKLEGTDYEDKGWWVFNFNDIIMAFVTWFTQLLCEYAPEWADALDNACPWGYIAWYIFPTFYVVGVAVIFEILKAFTIETYLALKEEEDGEGEEEESDSDSDGEEMISERVIRKTQERLAVKNSTLHCKEQLRRSERKEYKESYEEYLKEKEKQEPEKYKNVVQAAAPIPYMAPITVNYGAPVVEYAAPVVAVEYVAPAPVTEFVEVVPGVVGYGAPTVAGVQYTSGY